MQKQLHTLSVQNRPVPTQATKHPLYLTLLLLEAALASTLLTKSAQLFASWRANHTHEARPQDAVLLYTALFVACCAPFAFLLGVCTASVYYARKHWMYGGHEKGGHCALREKGYGGDSMDAGERAYRKGLGRLEERGYFERGQSGMQNDGFKKCSVGGSEAVLCAGLGEGVEVIFVSDDSIGAEGYVEAARQSAAAITLPEPVGQFERSQFTKKGVTNIWARQCMSKCKGGYEGQDVRRKAWEEEGKESNGFSS